MDIFVSKITIEKTQNVKEKNFDLLTKEIDNVPLSEDWKMKDSVLFRDFGTTPSNMIISLDLDETLIKTKSGTKFAKNQNDWKLLKDNITSILEEYIKNGFKVVIFTNQAGISTGKTNKKAWTSKVSSIQKKLKIPVQVFAATEVDFNRKPAIGMWKLMIKEFNGKCDVNLKESFFVGDAAGRDKTKDRSKDYSDSDYKFALNIGINFKTPELFYDNIFETLPVFDLFSNLLKKEKSIPLFKNVVNSYEKLFSSSLEMIILTGSPGSGKSTFYHNYLKPRGYFQINHESYKKCLILAEEELRKGISVVIDSNINSPEERAEYINLSKRLRIDIRTFVFNFSKELVFHLNDMRYFNNFRIHYSKIVDDLNIETWLKEFAYPTVKEGFKEILEVEFVPGPFENQDDEKLFYSYT